MDIVRVILVALVAFSVTVVPLAGGMALSMPHGMSLAAQQADCCPHGKPCEKKTDGCGSMAGCALKCFNFSGAIASRAVVKPAPAADLAPVLASLSFHSNPTAPPLPPPRV
jgi:hypothetical protein